MSEDSNKPREAITVTQTQYDILAPRLYAYLERLADEPTKRIYTELAQALERREIPEHLEAHLAWLIEVVLEGGQIRKKSGPLAEYVLLELFHKTCRSREIATRLSHINRLLDRALRASVTGINVEMRIPGVYMMTIVTNELKLSLRFDRTGPHVDNLELGIA